jgi:GNAT superfamily N-acetyltransferase
VWVLNQLTVDAPTDAGGLIGALDELYSHLPHRRAFVEQDEIGERLAPTMRDAGWLVERDVFMVLRRERDRDPQPGLAREVDEATIRAVEAQTIGEEPYGEPAVLEQLLASRAAFGRAGSARYFVAASEGVDGCHTTLYSDGVVAQVEDVGTLKAMRGRGLARAACSAALDAAIAAGHDLVFVVADDEDWPKDLYAKLGFDPVGRPWAFTRPGPEHPAHRPAQMTSTRLSSASSQPAPTLSATSGSALRSSSRRSWTSVSSVPPSGASRRVTVTSES